MADKERKYHMTYLVRPCPEGLPKSRIVDGEGACDDIVIHSIVRPDDGGLSHMVVSCDGRKGEPLSAGDLWQIWTMWAHSLAKCEDLDTNRRMICQMVHETVRDAILAVREQDEAQDTEQSDGEST